MPIVPPKRPELTRAAALQLCDAAGVSLGARPVIIVGRRGYYRDTMGKSGENDIGIYDDAVAVLSPTAYVTFNANTDPSRMYPDVAVLQPGLWNYAVGTHGLSRPESERYEALVQASAVTVKRSGTEDVAKGTRDERGLCLGDSLWTNDERVPTFGLNIHRGGYHVTSSAGCQTIWPDQWDAFLALVKTEMERYHQPRVPYLLTEREAA